MFSQPTGGDWFKPRDHVGHLLLFLKIHEIRDHFDSFKNSTVKAASFDFVDLDEPGQETHSFVNDTHVGVVNKLVKAARTGEMVLGRIATAPTNQGQNAFILAPYTEGTDDVRAQQWLNAQNGNNFGQPAEAQAAPVPAPTAPTPAAQPQITPEIAALLAQLQAQQGQQPAAQPAKPPF